MESLVHDTDAILCQDMILKSPLFFSAGTQIMTSAIGADEPEVPRDSARAATLGWKICVIVLGLVLLVVSARSYWVKERPYVRREAAWRKSRSGHEKTLETIRSNGGIARNYYDKYCVAGGVYVDLSPWHGTKTDLASCLTGLGCWDFGFEQSFISLQGLDVGDEDLALLESLNGLEVLVLTDTQVTDAGVATLQQAIPYLLIIRDADDWQRLISTPGKQWLANPPDLKEYEL